MFTFFMIKELLLTAPLILSTPLAAQQTEQRRGVIDLQSSLQYANTQYNANNQPVMYEQGSYLYPTAQEYNIGGLIVTQKTYIYQYNVNVIGGTPDQPTWRSVPYTEVLYFVMLEKNVEEIDHLNFSLNITLPEIDTYRTGSYWNYRTTNRWSNEQMDGVTDQDIFPLLQAKETNLTTLKANYTTLNNIVTAYGIDQQFGLLNVYYSRVQEVVADTQPSLIISDWTANIPYYWGVKLTYEPPLNLDLYVDMPINLSNTMFFMQFPQSIYARMTVVYTPVDTGAIDITDTIFTIVAMPFAFIAQAFDFTLFPGTAYAINVSRILLAIVVFGIGLYIIRRYIS